MDTTTRPVNPDEKIYLFFIIILLICCIIIQQTYHSARMYELAKQTINVI